MKTTYIYALVDPETEDVRYIGKTVNLQQRLASHCNEKSNCHRSHWIQGLRRKGLKPIMMVIEEIKGEWPWQHSERYWIRYALRHGCRLTNNTSGGDGVPDLHEDAKNKIRQTWIGRNHTEGTKAKIGMASRERRHSESTKQLMSKAHSGRLISWGDKISESLRKLTDEQVDEIKRRLSLGELGINLSREFGVHRTTVSKIKAGTYYEKFRK